MQIFSRRSKVPPTDPGFDGLFPTPRQTKAPKTGKSKTSRNRSTNTHTLKDILSHGTLKISAYTKRKARHAAIGSTALILGWQGLNLLSEKEKMRELPPPPTNNATQLSSNLKASGPGISKEEQLNLFFPKWRNYKHYDDFFRDEDEEIRREVEYLTNSSSSETNSYSYDSTPRESPEEALRKSYASVRDSDVLLAGTEGFSELRVARRLIEQNNIQATKLIADLAYMKIFEREVYDENTFVSAIARYFPAELRQELWYRDRAIAKRRAFAAKMATPPVVEESKIEVTEGSTSNEQNSNESF